MVANKGKQSLSINKNDLLQEGGTQQCCQAALLAMGFPHPYVHLHQMNCLSVPMSKPAISHLFTTRSAEMNHLSGKPGWMAKTSHRHDQPWVLAAQGLAQAQGQKIIACLHPQSHTQHTEGSPSKPTPVTPS